MFLAELSWASDVNVPVLLMLTIGTVQAIYTGLIASRMYTFVQTRNRAAHWMLEVNQLFAAEYKSPHDFAWALTNAGTGMIMEFRAQGHEKAANHMSGILRYYLNIGAEITQTPIPAEGLPRLPGSSTPQQMQMFLRTLSQRYGDTFLRYAASIAGLKPDWGALFTPVPFPDWITVDGAFVGLGKRRVSRWERLGRYISGEAEDW